MKTESHNRFGGAAIVVAHPDDEILWFSSVLKDAGQVVICFLEYPALPSLGEGRRAVLAEYPLSTASWLEVTEAQSFDTGDWSDPTETPYGLKIAGNAKVEGRYRENFDALVRLLRPKLAGCENVFTHNPWGEYGHEDHVQVYRAVEALRAELGFDLWFSGYCGNRSLKLMVQYLSQSSVEHVTLPTNPRLAEDIALLYQRHDCWTWDDDYAWFERESFLRECKGASERRGACRHALPLNFLQTDFSPAGAAQEGGLSKVLRLPGRAMKRLIACRDAAPASTPS